MVQKLIFMRNMRLILGVKNLGCTRVELQKAVKAVGDSSKKVKKYFESH